MPNPRYPCLVPLFSKLAIPTVCGFLLCTACGDGATSEFYPDPCSKGSLNCGGTCVTLASDPDHCGACSTGCNSAEVCSLGNCAVQCHPGLDACNRGCVDVRANNANCGACGNQCASGEVCSDGSCATSCREGLAQCASGCVDLASDYFNCGGCGNTCESGEVCSLGHCSVSCHAGLEECNRGCVDVGSNSGHCGSCGHACDASQVCSLGECVAACEEGLLKCGTSCVDGANSFLNCGGCGKPCSPGEICVKGQCASSFSPDWEYCSGEIVNLMNDPRHCGSCQISCDDGDFCDHGVCASTSTCADGLVACDGTCVDTRHDPNHCGDCAVKCEVAPNGNSIAVCHDQGLGDGPECGIVCSPGFYDCDGDIGNGCEFDGKGFDSDTDNCGACGIRCNTSPVGIKGDGSQVPAEACVSGRCWGSPHDRYECESTGGKPTVVDGCPGEKNWLEILSSCCDFPSLCDTSDIAPILACECPEDQCFGYRTNKLGCWTATQLDHGKPICEAECLLGAPCEDGKICNGLRECVTPPMVAVGGYHTCGVNLAGGAQCWGQNSAGQLGNGGTADAPFPTSVLGYTSNVKAVASALQHSCVLSTTGRIACWGNNSQGELGNGETGSTRVEPTEVKGITTDIQVIATGTFHSCAITLAGGLLCWGDNSRGQIGDTTVTRRPLPTAVSGLESDVMAVSAGENHNCAVTKAGAVLCWGQNYEGQLGNGTWTNANAPTPVSGLSSGYVAVACGWTHTCALSSAGAVHCWGDNTYGALGDGTTTFRNIPTPVVSLSSGVTAISAGHRFTCAITVGGGLSCWGTNGQGQLGDGTTVFKLVPTPVVGLPSGVISVSTGDMHTCAVTLASAGEAFCWGRNTAGQLGDNSSAILRVVPSRVYGFP